MSTSHATQNLDFPRERHGTYAPEKQTTSFNYHDHLIQSNLLTPQQLTIAKEEQQLSGTSLRAVILKMGFLTEEKLMTWLEQELSYDVYSPENHDIETINPSLYKEKEEDLYSLRATPLSFDENNKVLTVALADVLDVTRQDALKRLYPQATSLKILIAREKDIIRTLDTLYTTTPSSPQYQGGLTENRSNITYLAQEPETKPQLEATEFIEQILESAVKQQASDIHFAPEELFVRVRLRVDGILSDHHLFHKSQWSAILSRLKILSHMNIAETRLPQSGRFSQQIAGRTIDFRTSAHPTANGENFVLRSLDRLHTFFELPDLGFSPEHIEHLKQQLNQPYGIIVITGPTGSGKTTTLYSMLSYLRSKERNIMTLEDPIEYEMHNIRQTQVQPDIGFDFPQGVRSILRQDPDVILIGEIRDEETAKMALRAAMTGHLVLTTLHTNSALLAINRLVDLGIDASLLSGNINCILSQRLVRKPLPKTRGNQLGRRPLAEILNVSPELDSLFTQKAPYHELLTTARQQGFRTMQEQAKSLLKTKELALENVQDVLAYDDIA